MKMASVIHISEAEAARDFSAVMDRALAGEEIVVRRGDKEIVMLVPERKSLPEGRTLDEIMRLARDREAERGGLAEVDDEFASDMEKIHVEMNQPMDGSKWD
jgi:antitoxin (DNA-binding transcriptional repressor) of toxin-antitoxin stability system